MIIRLAVLALSLLATQAAMGQAAPAEITNADVISMAKAGIGEQTIIIAIERGPVKFDTSPQALIALKAGGVSDPVLNAILASVNNNSQLSPGAQGAAAQALFQKALDAIGPNDKIEAIHSYRWKGSLIQGAKSFERETVRIYPDRIYTSVKAATGPLQKQVITSEFNYRTTGAMTVAVPPADLAKTREGFEFEIIYIAQHPENYTVTSEGTSGAENSNAGVDRVKISKSGRGVIWKIDPQTGRILSASQGLPSGDIVTDYSDWRSVSGVNVPFERHTEESGRVSDIKITDYVVNPAIDESIFQRPAETPSQGLTLKVLQEQSVPYTQESGGGISTSCNIVGTANTSANANTIGNTTFGNATTNSNQHMSCNSYDTTMRWPHVLNVMFAEGSDGNSYIFACDRAWRWSKCVPLRAGQVFNARFTDKGLEVESFNTKGKEESPTYHVLQSRSSR